ncbi:MAG: glycosyltransferase family 4 protein, partial [Prolixibacteraceae bacterium]
ALSPDLVIVRFWIPFMGMALGTICREIMKNGRTKIIALTDNLIPHEKRIGDQILIKYFTGSVHGFIAMSKQVLSDISKYEFKKPKKYTPHPVYDHYGEIEEREIALGKLSLDPQNRYILFFGIIRDYKGLDLLLHAFSDSYFADNNIKLIVAGEFYTDEDRYMKIISEMNLKNQVILRTEYIPNSEVPDYFNAADIIVQPYKTATQSGVTQIGYHFNTPMLVTNVGGLAEIIPHMKAGYVVEPNPEAISGALKDYFTNRRMSEFKANITKEKERFSWDKMTSAFYQLMNELKNGEH